MKRKTFRAFVYNTGILGHVFTLFEYKGFECGLQWVHGGGSTSKTSMVLASNHPLKSITWTWALDWTPPNKCKNWGFEAPTYRSCYNGNTDTGLSIPLIGNFTLRTQKPMWKK